MILRTIAALLTGIGGHYLNRRWDKAIFFQYYVEIKKITREGTTTHFEKVTSRILSEQTALPLSSLKHVKTTGNEKQEYGAEIFAFSEDGTLLAEYSDTWRGGTFLLTDGSILVEDSFTHIFDPSSNMG
jgi:hypothetical protein